MGGIEAMKTKLEALDAARGATSGGGGSILSFVPDLSSPWMPLMTFAVYPADISDLLYQVQRFHSFIWASGGNFNDFYIYIIDHLGWMKNAWPVKAQALGARHYRQSPDGVTYVDQNLDTYGVEYTYADGTKFFFDGRCMTGCMDQYASYMHGTKGMAVASSSGDCGQPSRIYKSQNPRRSDMTDELIEKATKEGDFDQLKKLMLELDEADANRIIQARRSKSKSRVREQ